MSSARFKRAAADLVRQLYRLEWHDFRSERDFELIEQVILLAIATIQYHVLKAYSPRNTGECAYFADMIERLAAAVDAVRRGLPPNPDVHPSQESVEAAVNDRLMSVLRNRAARDRGEGAPPER